MASSNDLPTDAPLRPLAGCVIAICGAIPRVSQKAIEHDYIKSLGAEVAKKITRESLATHLITTQRDVDKLSVKVMQARDAKIHIVSFEWLRDTHLHGTRMDESAYTLEHPERPDLKRKAVHQPVDDDGDYQLLDYDDDDRYRKPLKLTRENALLASPLEAVQPEHIPQKNPSDPDISYYKSQLASSRDIRVPVHCDANKHRGYEVYIDEHGVVYDAFLCLCKASSSYKNSNRFLRLQIIRNVKNHFVCVRQSGRVGDPGSHTTLETDGTLVSALSEFHTVFRANTGLHWVFRRERPKIGKYAFVEMRYEPELEGEDDGKKPEGMALPDGFTVRTPKTPGPVWDLMRLILDRQYFAGAHRGEPNKLSKNTINRGFEILQQLSIFLRSPATSHWEFKGDRESVIRQMSDRYHSVIPTNRGRRHPEFIEDMDAIKRERENLEKVRILAKDDVLPSLNLDFRIIALGLTEMTPLSRNTSEYIELEAYLMATRGATHTANFEISQIFRVERRGEKEAFESTFALKVDRRLLWHGSRCTNFAGILPLGLRIAPPEAQPSGYMYGKGVYLADMSSKSAQYCHPKTSNGHALLLLCEVELGYPSLELTTGSSTAAQDAQRWGLWSTTGLGRTGPVGWKDASCIHPSLNGVWMPDTLFPPGHTGRPSSLLYNEYVVYNVAQIRLRYLFRVRM
ncbi:PARP-domain-containing protein [Hypoxylon sp. FL0543]|nr:PARP-domain-containing protein [Hypoxylon sp. FL0543]